MLSTVRIEYPHNCAPLITRMATIIEKAVERSIRFTLILIV